MQGHTHGVCRHQVREPQRGSHNSDLPTLPNPTFGVYQEYCSSLSLTHTHADNTHIFVVVVVMLSSFCSGCHGPLERNVELAKKTSFYWTQIGEHAH